MDYKSNIQRFGIKAALEKSKEYIPHMQPGFTISVNEVIEGKNRILNLEKAKTILKESTDLALLHCACRLNHENRCDGTLHACILLNDVAKGFLTEEKANHPRQPEHLTLDRALEVLTETHNAGLVHMAYNINEDTDPTDFTAVCSCCICCCGQLQPRLTYAPDLLVKDSVSVIDADQCISCGTCVDRCQFGARSLDNGKIRLDQSRCYGCGVCVSTCPEDAISLIPTA